ncbi:MAG: cyclase family protein [Ilumatobacteraceae bacterium]
MTDLYGAVREVAAQVSNWGRWGDADELGTLNLITTDAVRRGAATVRTGKSFTMGVTFGADGPQTGTIPGRFNPQHYMTAVSTSYGDPPDPRGFHFNDDVIVMPLQAATQWDSLAHVHYDGQLYNGFPVAESINSWGAHHDGIDKQAEQAYATRGILIDAARLRGVDKLTSGDVITPAMLDEALDHAKLRVEAGDVVLIRTGHINTWKVDGDRMGFNFGAPGIGIDAVHWLHQHDVAAIASDTTLVEVMPAEDPRLICPVHLLTIRDMGMPLGEIFDLEALAADCADDGVYEFQFVAQPLKVAQGVGSPINPIALK